MNGGRFLGEATMTFLVLLVLLSATHALPDPLNLNSSGLAFVIVFPENIAYYHPIQSKNTVEIYSPYEGTTITFPNLAAVPADLTKGNTKHWTVDVELQRQPTSNRTWKVYSTKPIIVRTISSKDQSIQSSLIRANDKAGLLYKIPPLPGQISELLQNPSDVPERAPFTVIVTNAGVKGTVDWRGADDKVVTLAPFEAAQFWMSAADVAYEVEASEPVSVLFGHPCYTVFNCTCGMIVTPLDPAADTDLNYVVPPDFLGDSGDKAELLVAGEVSPLPYDPDSPTVQSVGSVVFHRPGLLLSILPEEDFASCFQISIAVELGVIERYAVLVVHKDHKDLVHYGNEPISGAEWNDIKTTDYVSTSVKLVKPENIFWQPKSMMAVYHFAANQTTLFGNPAAIISKYTSLAGCVIVPEVAYLGEEEMGWVESHHYCKSLDLELAAMGAEELHMLAPKLHAANQTVPEVWIGYRRNSLTGDWYRLIGGYRREVVDTHWAAGEPGEPDEGQCAMMSLDPEKDFGWNDNSCCTSAVPLCYKPPELLPIA